MPRHVLSLAFAGAAALALSACDTARDLPQQAAAASGCTLCHGDASRAEANPLLQAAPPRSVTGADGGAHAIHLHGSALSAPIACDECHVVPDRLDHANGTVDVAFGPLARKGGVDPKRLANGTCAVWCHGASLSGGPAASPAWTAAGALGCTSCHGYPPPSHAPSSTTCSSCHPGTVRPDGSIDVANGLHVNGAVDVGNLHPAGWSDPTQHGYAANRGGLVACKGCHGARLDGGTAGVSCTACHGNAGFPSWDTTCTFCHGDRASGRASPPLDTQGRGAATNVSVGAHASHVGTTIASPIACTECHPARTASVIDDAAHVDGDGQAEVEFGSLARAGGVTPSYSRVSPASATCASTYCHGNFTGGKGANAAPDWTSATQVSCTSCHSAPPQTGHHGDHAGRSCGDCHPGYDTTTVNAATHVDGTKQVGNRITSWNPATRQCVGCHGSATW